MTEQYFKAEIVRAPWTGEQWVTYIGAAILSLAVLTLIVWWFFAAWLPELGLTYWQLILPVFIVRQLFGGRGLIGRQLKNK